MGVEKNVLAQRFCEEFLQLHLPWTLKQSIFPVPSYTNKTQPTVDGSEFPNNHLGCCKNPVNNGRSYLSTDGFLPSTVSLLFKVEK